MTVNPRKMKVVALREELARRGKPTTGLKNDLIARLEAALDEEAFGLEPAGTTEAVASGSLEDPEADDAAAPEEEAAAAAAAAEAPAPAPAAAAAQEPEPAAAAPAPAPAPAPAAEAQDGEAAAAATNGAEGEAAAAGDASLTEEEVRKRRAERFGVPLVTPKQTEAERKAARAARFGLAAGGGGGAAAAATTAEVVEEVDPAIEEARRKRAERFGIPFVPLATLRQQKAAARKEAASKRGNKKGNKGGAQGAGNKRGKKRGRGAAGVGGRTEAEEAALRKKRAERFTKKPAVEVSAEELERRKQRAARFAAAPQ